MINRSSELELVVLAGPAVSRGALPDWALVGGLVAAVAGLVALVTALVNLWTARVASRNAARVPTADSTTPRQKVLLPARSHFVNRDEELRRAVARIHAGEIVVAIEGALGVGKSATATELAWRLRGDRPADQPILDLEGHTFVWVDGRDRPPSLTEICRPLSLLTGDQSLTVVADDEKLDALRAHLSANKTVLVLDNLKLAHDPASEMLRDLVRTVPAGSLVIASVNRPGALDGSRVALRELDPAHVLELVHHQVLRLGLSDEDMFDEAFVTRLQRVLGGNPRMIEWFLRGFCRSSQSLDERLAAVERGEGLQELFAPAWRDLDDKPRDVLAACAHLRGEAIADQLVIACRLTDDAVSFALEHLVREGLVVAVRVSGRPQVFTCAPALQRFVAAETPAEARASFTARLAEHFVIRFSSDREDARGAIPHIGALRVIVEELFARGDDDQVRALFGVALDILFTLGLFDDRIALGTLAYESGVRADGASLAAEVVSSTHAVRGEVDAARDAVALGLVAAERSGWPGEVARQKRCAGLVSYRCGNAAEALTLVQGADELARDADDLETLVNILELRAAAHWYLGALDDCEGAAEQSMRVCEEMPWERAKAYPLRYLAEIAIHRREARRAQELLDSAQAIAAEYSDRRHAARLTLTQARLHLLEGQLREATRTATEAEFAARRLGLPPESREARALTVAARRAGVVPPLRLFYARRRPLRLTDAPVGGD